MVKKSICIVITSLIGGGAQRLNLTLAEHLSNEGHKVSLIVLSSRNLDYKVNHLNVIFLDKEYPKKYFGLLKNHLKTRALNSMINKLERSNGRPFDYILASLPRTQKIFSKLKFDNVFYWLHNTLSKELERFNSENKYQKKLREFQKIYENKRLLVTSCGVKEDLLNTCRILPKSIDVLYNFFNFEEIEKLSMVDANLPLPKGEYIIHAGRFSKQKRHDLLFDAYKLSKINLPLVLLCKDSSDLHDLIESKNLTKKVKVVGFQQNPYPWMKNAKLMVLSSDYEGFGNVIVESLFLKTPVISTDCKSGPNEIMTGDFSEFLADTGNSADLAKKIQLAMDSKFDFTQLNIVSRFSVQDFVKKLFKL